MLAAQLETMIFLCLSKKSEKVRKNTNLTDDNKKKLLNIFFIGKLENIKVRFFELDDDQLIWEDWGKFTEADVHHQYAIALKTPPYHKTNIDESVRIHNIFLLFFFYFYGYFKLP